MEGAGFCSLYQEIHYNEIHYNKIWVYIHSILIDCGYNNVTQGYNIWMGRLALALYNALRKGEHLLC